MSWTKTVTLWCDGDGCVEWVETSNSTVKETRKNSGWTYRNDKDLCPDCA